MQKNDLLLKVSDLSNIGQLSIDLGCDEEYIQDLKDEGYTLSISAWEDGCMVDDHVMYLFPELNNIPGLDEPSEGDMYYSGPLSKSQMEDKLTSMGFDVD